MSGRVTVKVLFKSGSPVILTGFTHEVATGLVKTISSHKKGNIDIQDSDGYTYLHFKAEEIVFAGIFDEALDNLGRVKY
jgi:hypothetical protein